MKDEKTSLIEELLNEKFEGGNAQNMELCKCGAPGCIIICDCCYCGCEVGDECE